MIFNSQKGARSADGANASDKAAEEWLPEDSNADKVHKKVERTSDEHQLLHPLSHTEQWRDDRRRGREVGQRIIDCPRSGPRNNKTLQELKIIEYLSISSFSTYSGV